MCGCERCRLWDPVPGHPRGQKHSRQLKRGLGDLYNVKLSMPGAWTDLNYKKERELVLDGVSGALGLSLPGDLALWHGFLEQEAILLFSNDTAPDSLCKTVEASSLNYHQFTRKFVFLLSLL